MYDLTRGYYSHTSKPSIGPVVFFRYVLIGYLENIYSDRALERTIKLRLDLLYFIDHDLGESPPDHSTICKTRKRHSINESYRMRAPLLASKRKKIFYYKQIPK